MMSVSGGSVLVVDDLPTNLIVVQELLAPYGYTIDTAASGPEAIEMVKNHNYDLVLMDHMMPGMDGVEATAVIKALEKKQPIIAMTANAMREMEEYYLEQGFDGYLSKPIDPESLDKILIKWTKGRNRNREKNGGAKTENKKISSNYSQFSLELQAQRLDMLNHYCVSFTTVPRSEWQAKFDTAYYERFIALLESFDTTDMTARDQAKTFLAEKAAALMEAGRREDAYAIREMLPHFYEASLQEAGHKRKKQSPQDKTLDTILPKLKTAILAEETKTAESLIQEMGAMYLTPGGRELYFLLNHFLLMGDTEKALGAIMLREKMERDHD